MPLAEIHLTETWPGVYRLEAPWAYASNGLNDWIKTADGDRRRYHFDAGPKLGPKKAWYLPEERLSPLREFADDRGWPMRITKTMVTYDAGVALEYLSGVGDEI